MRDSGSFLTHREGTGIFLCLLHVKYLSSIYQAPSRAGSISRPKAVYHVTSDIHWNIWIKSARNERVSCFSHLKYVRYAIGTLDREAGL